mmetsp:Transcript_41639/g.63574  ORF Transcript_41639/g.63574 Transcript_41639/m.63574 type:complete len:114 (+) Transcript_41639:3872-4213(+)
MTDYAKQFDPNDFQVFTGDGLSTAVKNKMNMIDTESPHASPALSINALMSDTTQTVLRRPNTTSQFGGTSSGDGNNSDDSEISEVHSAEQVHGRPIDILPEDKEIVDDDELHN